MPELAPGLVYQPEFLDRAAQADLLATIRDVIAGAPLFTPRMPRTGQPFSVRMTNCGAFGWTSDVSGYRYETRHPVTGAPWPAIPAMLLDIWNKVTPYPAPPQACLVNLYDPTARMGLHQDRDEADFTAPVVSLSLGASCRFRFGTESRSGRTHSLKLHSGDLIVLSGPSRLIFHGVDRILATSSTLIPDGSRINLTMRRVTKPVA